MMADVIFRPSFAPGRRFQVTTVGDGVEWKQHQRSRVMRIAILFVVVAAIAGSLTFTPAAIGQQPQYQRYQPAGGPVLSPNLQFFRLDPGPLGLGQYLSFVQPTRRVQQAIQRQSRDFNLLENQVLRIGEQSVAAPTGVGGSFMNERRYFMNQNFFFETRSRPGSR